MHVASKQSFIFGGEEPWDPADWTDSDDRVRGGSSQSYLSLTSSTETTEKLDLARFHGVLDITTLGGAGFASQRTTGEDRCWDLSRYDGIRLDLVDGDEKTYTFNIKDELLPKNPETGREQSTVSYEYDFRFSRQDEKDSGTEHDHNGDGGDSDGHSVFIPWTALKATYRGKEKKDAPKLDVKSIKRFSIMMRSFFGEQEGPFSLSIRSISAVTKPEVDDALSKDSPAAARKAFEPKDDVEKGVPDAGEDGTQSRPSVLQRMFLFVKKNWSGASSQARHGLNIRPRMLMLGAGVAMIILMLAPRSIETSRV